jgi:hypothetical protein
MDPNGKKFTWQWVVLLPFIDENRLVAAVDSVVGTFTAEEVRRNTWGNELLFAHNKAALAPYLRPLVPRIDDEDLDAAAGAAPASSTNGAATGIATSASAAAAAPAKPSSTGAVTPCVAEAMALIERGAVASATLRPEMGDPVTLKGLSAYIISIKDGGGPARGVAAVALGGTVASPHPPVLLSWDGNQALGVTFLPPKRRPHVCRLLQGTELARRVLTPDDDASQRVPRLTRGMNIADLALSREQREQRERERMYGYGGGFGGGGGGGGYGGRGGGNWNGPAAAGQLPVYQSQYGPPQGQGYSYARGPPPPQGLNASQRLILGTLGIATRPPPPGTQHQQQQMPPGARPAFPHPPPYGAQAHPPPYGAYGGQQMSYPPSQAPPPYGFPHPYGQGQGRPPPPYGYPQAPPAGPPSWQGPPGYGAPPGAGFLPMPPPRQPYTPFQPPPYSQPPPYAPQQPPWPSQQGPYSYQPRR